MYWAKLSKSQAQKNPNGHPFYTTISIFFFIFFTFRLKTFVNINTHAAYPTNWPNFKIYALHIHGPLMAEFHAIPITFVSN